MVHHSLLSLSVIAASPSRLVERAERVAGLDWPRHQPIGRGLSETTQSAHLTTRLCVVSPPLRFLFLPLRSTRALCFIRRQLPPPLVTRRRRDAHYPKKPEENPLHGPARRRDSPASFPPKLLLLLLSCVNARHKHRHLPPTPTPTPRPTGKSPPTAVAQ